MLEEEKLDVLVVTTVDATHDQYIIPALHAGIRVLTEKPMTTSALHFLPIRGTLMESRDVEKCRKILKAVDDTNGSLQGQSFVGSEVVELTGSQCCSTTATTLFTGRLRR